MKTTRRDFIRGTTILAAGAVAGVGIPKVVLGKSFRKSGFVQLKVHLPMRAAPYVIKGALFVDASKDIFGIQSYDSHGHHAAETMFSLSEIMKATRSSSPGTPVWAVNRKDGQVRELFMTAGVEGEKFVLREVGAEHWPLWIQAKDVRAIL
jgi:hypothetical protein